MPVPYKHIRHQTKTIATLGNVAVAALKQQLGEKVEVGAGVDEMVFPGPENRVIIPPRPPALVKDFVRNIGGSPSAYKTMLPPHFFPQWIFAPAERTIVDAPYPLFKMVNGGTRMEVNGPLPNREPLLVSARLDGIDDNGRRAILHQRIATGTRDEPELVVAHVYEVVPLGGGKKGKKKAPELVPADARELAFWKIPRDAGLAFAALTGDFNPLHWIRPYARAFGFKSTILHGFASMGRAIEGLNRSLFSGDVTRITVFDARFTRPLVLPARVGLYLRDQEVFVGDGPGGPAYLVGSFETKDSQQTPKEGEEQ